MNTTITINKRTLFVLILTSIFLGLCISITLLFIRSRAYAQKIIVLEQEKSKLEAKIQETDRIIMAKDNEIAQLIESKQSLEQSRRVQESQEKVAEEALESLRKIDAAIMANYTEAIATNRTINSSMDEYTHYYTQQNVRYLLSEARKNISRASLSLKNDSVP